MINHLQIFNYNGAKVRTVIENGQVLFIAKDVCAVLGLKQVSRALNGLNKNDSRLLLVTHPQNPCFINYSKTNRIFIFTGRNGVKESPSVG